MTSVALIWEGGLSDIGDRRERNGRGAVRRESVPDESFEFLRVNGVGFLALGVFRPKLSGVGTVAIIGRLGTVGVALGDSSVEEEGITSSSTMAGTGLRGPKVVLRGVWRGGDKAPLLARDDRIDGAKYGLAKTSRWWGGVGGGPGV